MQNHKIIPLVNGGQTIVDEADSDALSKHRWFRSSGGYAYRQGWKNGEHWEEFMHRVVNGTPPHLFTDHINGNKLDNRRSNLRTCTKAQNMANSRKLRLVRGSSNLKGVSFHPSTGLWRARITDGEFECTTYHRTEQQAALDYNRMAKERFGEYAQLNELPEGIQPTVRRQKTSQFRGVGFHKKSGKWRASIDADGTTKTIGAYLTEIEAARAYNEAAKRLRGDRAVLNDV